eukprot:CAMPEP_0114409938 /NCGR_PEP_ID=MMETSP0102-20121206/23726_1 /TAXON_ID=38822 ORGANISM="Pteridomonas danica, Strain PT" /NCGR_SAMPLE_ID=MMETSP0102 /ASSEMBLY_ACC=CAM_ASM_000212 /LENGTH=103 /DNA_ID=CAMNT_0001577473 /DNA_START=97 /DNA_END=408 /DNA_ORIENTATION=-
MREGGFNENCRALEVKLDQEGTLKDVEDVIKKLELEKLEKQIAKEASKKEAQLLDAANGSRKGSAFARKSNDATAHFRSMTGTKSEQLYVNRNGGYTTFHPKS